MGAVDKVTFQWVLLDGRGLKVGVNLPQTIKLPAEEAGSMNRRAVLGSRLTAFVVHRVVFNFFVPIQGKGGLVGLRFWFVPSFRSAALKASYGNHKQ